ncbi:group 1 glycosyl transferase [Scytonema sp. HK-05]|uniref:glycosyltransferase family 4 protein n=1 Tax=Scytonema sp. HK-05 TaxID=1137095 RepID=UPI000935D23B|nr:glycosyltransferase family 4 protein [Scytonema sp. HK-05]OKH57342.1 colanic acid biosynthesis glycosyltransferase WcaL [Scytonema sp. HK-05]BAY47268.1 group 1 glycosyl transferase [Scytonema sp. HK-05]
MRIAYLTGEYPRATDTFIQREVTTLREMGVDVHTFSVRRTGDEHMVGTEQKLERDRTFYILPPNPINLILAHLSLLLAFPKRYLQAIKLAWSTSQPGLRGALFQIFYFLEAGILAKQIKQRQIVHLHNHIVEASGTVAMLAAEMGGFTYSFTLHGPYIFFRPHQWRLDEKIKRSLFVCCISHYARSQGMIFAPTEKWNRMHIIHCGIDPALFDVVSHNESGKRLLFVGRLAAAKGLPILLESLVSLRRSHPNISLTVVGDGPDRQKLEQTTAQLGLSQNVKFVGYKSQGEVRDYFQQTDIFVMSSFAEGIPVVLMEAMAAGVPVVATQIAGVSELVEDGVNGYLVPPGDPVSLAENIEILLSNHKLRAAFGTAGRAKVEKDFNIHHEVARLHNLMKSALQGDVEPIRPNYPEKQVFLTKQETVTTSV